MSNKITDFKKYIIDRVKKEKGPLKTLCWIWQPAKFKCGYGVAISNNGSYKENAHRVSYRAFNGQIPNNMYILHSCDIRACCNPNHLRIGTPQDNMDDRVKRSRCNTEKSNKTKFKRYGWVITPKGKFKTFQQAADSVDITNQSMQQRIKSKNFPKYYREKCN